MSGKEWKDTWINTLIESGFSRVTAHSTYQAMYGDSGPDIGKNAAQDAYEMLGKLKTEQDISHV